MLERAERARLLGFVATWWFDGDGEFDRFQIVIEKAGLPG